MQPITISRQETILGHHTTDSPLSHYGQPVWLVEESEPSPGPAQWAQGDHVQSLTVLGIVGGWLVARQSDGLLIGILWSDGTYYAEVIEERRTRRPAKRATLNSLRHGRYCVRGTITAEFIDPHSPLGCRLG
jgi:hypothetical protein